MGRLSYITRRLVKGLFVLLAIVILNFFLIRAAPGDPAQVMAGEAGASDEMFIEQLQERFGLNRPLHEQLFIYVKGIVTLDMGWSYRQDQSVASLIGQRLPATLLLTGTAFCISLMFGVLMGALAAARVGKWTDSLITTVALIFYATPLFWIALMAILLFSVYLGWLPGFGMVSVGAGYTGLAYIGDILAHLVLPALTLGLFYTAVYARMTRASMLEVMAGIQAGQMIGGAVLTETVFAWPGIGRLMFDALLQRDYNLLLGIFFVSSAMVVLFNLITDLVYTFVDPRIEVS